MFARASSGSLFGVDAHHVVVESHRAKGLPGIALIGLARGAVRESLVRVRSAIVACGLRLSSFRLVINLLPAELPKETSALDLALAVCLLASEGILPPDVLKGRRFYGELSLGGGIESVRGAILVADLARRRGDHEIFVPSDNAKEAAVIPGIRVIGIDHLQELVEHLLGHTSLPVTSGEVQSSLRHSACLSQVRGQLAGKRALEIAAAGNHNMLMSGPPGSGKTMLARCMSSLLPRLDDEARIEVTRIHSAAGLLKRPELFHIRPFRAPHHTASEVALCGGGSTPRPGEVTLAHRGVLFLDELPEFSRRALETLREPLEEGLIRISRAAGTLEFPAKVLLVAAMNPCPCGAYRRKSISDHPNKCLCSFEQIQRYRSRISGPLLDRIDVHVWVDTLSYREYTRGEPGEPSNSVAKRVLEARAIQEHRLGPNRANSDMTENQIRQHVKVDAAVEHMLDKKMSEHSLSARSISRILKLTRTIADLDKHRTPKWQHFVEAIALRLGEHLDRNQDQTKQPYGRP
jgi:magnesium chelatase family protein